MNAAGRTLARLLGVAAAAVLSAGSARAQPVEVAGVAVEVSVAPLDGGPQSRIAFRVTDARSGQPLVGLHPLAWMTRAARPEAPDDAACRDRVKGLLEGRLAGRAEADLNRFLLLALNGDASISFIDPQVAFSRTRLEALLALPSPGADWALSRDGGTLYVSMPDADAVAVVDTATHRLRAAIPTGPGSRPTRLALAPGSGRLWVDLAGAEAVAVVADDALAARLDAPHGAHRFAFSSDGATVLVSGTASGRVAFMDAAALAGRTGIDLGDPPAAIGYGPASGLFYAALEAGGVVALDPRSGGLVATVAAPPGIAALGFEPDGRFALLANRVEGTLSVLDTADHRLSAPVVAAEGADQIAFSRSYAYVRGQQAARFALFELDQLRQGRLEPVVIRTDDGGTEAAEAEPALAAMTAPSPDGAGAMLAGAGGRRIYVYAEGMMAPAGTLDAYGHRVRGLLVHDRSLRETAPGTYAGTVRLARAGSFDVPFLIDRPRLVHCFRTEVAGEGRAAAAQGLRVEPVADADGPVLPGVPVRLAFRIVDPATGEAVRGLRDVQVLAFEPPGTWQRRRVARDGGNGIYAAAWAFPRPGRYDIALSIPSRGIGYADRPAVPITVQVATPAAGDQP